MRPPLEAWKLADEAIQKLFFALEVVASGKPATEQIDALADARKAAEAFNEHVWSSEECETP